MNYQDIDRWNIKQSADAILRERNKELLNKIKRLEAENKEQQKTIRELKCDNAQLNAMLDAIEDDLDGGKVSDFMQSFGIVRRVIDRHEASINEELKGKESQHYE